MRKTAITLLLAVLGIALFLSSCFLGSSILFLESDAADKPNLILNPGFETNPLSDNRMPPGWLLMDSTLDIQDPISCDYSEFVIGNQSLKIEKSTRYLMIISEPFRVDSYGGYFVKASAKSTAAKGPKIKIRFIGYSEHGKIRSTFNTSIKTDTTWRKSTISAGFLKQNVRFGRVLIIVPPTDEDTIWIDDVGCYEVHRFKIDY